MEAPNHDSFVQSTAGRHCEFFNFDGDELDTSELQVRIINPATTQRLLYPQHSHYHSNNPPTAFAVENNIDNEDDDAETLLSNLRRIAPSVAKDFVTKSSYKSSLQFKLVYDFDDLAVREPSYIAISYAWKKAHRLTPQKIVSPVGDLPFGWVQTVEQFPLPTSKGLFMGVLNEREEGEGLWFDQVCIDQENEAEKAVTIGVMDRIYRNARMVVVVLDDIATTWDELVFLQRYVRQFDMLADYGTNQQLRQPNQGLHPPFMERNFLFWSFVEKVLDSIWFSSAWCHHEMRLGTNHVFLVSCPAAASYQGGQGLCTVVRFTGHFLVHMLLLAAETTSHIPSRQAQIQSLLHVFGRILQTELHHNDSDTIQSNTSTKPSKALLVPNRVSLVPTITEVFQLKAGGNPRLPEHLRRLDANRDKISIALNIANFPLALKPIMKVQRPSLEDETFRMLLLAALAAGDPLALCTTGTPLKLHDGSVSWLNRPSPLDHRYSRHANPGSMNPFLPRYDLENMTQGSDGHAEYIQLELIFLERVPPPYTHAEMPSRRAACIIRLCEVHTVQSSNALWSVVMPHDSYTRYRQQYQRTRINRIKSIFIETLTCAFECGLEWLIDAATIAQQQSPQLLPKTPLASLIETHLTTIFTPSIPFNIYLSHTPLPQKLTSFALLLDILGDLITAGIPWASGGTEATHGPLVVTLPKPYRDPQPKITEANNKAVLFVPFTNAKTQLIAVPKALSGLQYKPFPRAWVLTPKAGLNAEYCPMSPPRDSAYSLGFGGGTSSSMVFIDERVIEGSVAGSGLTGQKAIRWVLGGKGVLLPGKGFHWELARVGNYDGTGSSLGRPHWIYGAGVDDR
ncbi:hypothetical protein DM02DRAFT_688097 [Periconia macrospinosa]|uniref:Heterokaryon incompatibility domain-containing protein n=1 Tax=Periconia macrospinosa TaxID=97972 RepID=A0A2V1E764_9PLEO|nr:hypothetical protein DM02DRAFT_688097 [Periconia macrospinosa]